MTQTLGPVMLDLEGQALTAGERELLRSPEVGGVILFGRNIASVDQVRTLCGEIRRQRPELLIALDRWRRVHARLEAMASTESPRH